MNASPGDLTLEWVDGLPELQALAQEWDALVTRTDAVIFLSPRWLFAWWPILGAGRPLTALIARRNGSLVGILPFMIDTVWVGPIPLRVARWAATDPNCMVLTLPIDPGLAAPLLARACADLLDTKGCSAVCLTPVSDRATFLPDLRQLATQPDLIVTDEPQGSHVMFDLPASFDDYTASQLTNKRRGQLRREMTALTAEYAMTDHSFIPTPTQFDDFVTFHNLQWQAQNKGGHFSDWPDSAAVYRAMIPHSAPDHGLIFYAQTGTSGALATQLCLTSGRTSHWRLPARTLDPRADKLSIGKIGMILMIQALIAQGVTSIEGGRGEYDYKTAHGGQNIPVHRILISRPGAIARLKLRLLRGWSDILDFAYYRVWFKKLSPVIRQKTGLPARPLWRIWIRSRL